MKTKKPVRPAAEGKTSGMKLVEKYRPRMNTLSRAERQKLLDRAMQIAYGEPEQRAAERVLP